MARMVIIIMIIMIMIMMVMMMILMMLEEDDGGENVDVDLMILLEEKQSFLVAPLSPSTHFLAIFIQV